MRTPLFLSTLFAVGMLGGVALADKPVKALEAPRAHGDTVDKSYKGAERPAGAREFARQTVATSSHAAKPDRSASRVNCSDSGADCAAKGGEGASHAAMAETASSAGNRVGRIPAFLDKVLGSDRTNFNEAGEDEGMSIRAANRAWAHAGQRAGSGSGKAAASLSEQSAVSRKENQASTNRTACNDADQCMASSKQSKKEWAYLAVKAGTWQGPESTRDIRGGATRASGAAAAATKSAAADKADKADKAAADRSHEHQD